MRHAPQGRAPGATPQSPRLGSRWNRLACPRLGGRSGGSGHQCDSPHYPRRGRGDHCRQNPGGLPGPWKRLASRGDESFRRGSHLPHRIPDGDRRGHLHHECRDRRDSPVGSALETQSFRCAATEIGPPESVMYCTNCGSKVSDTAKACSQCGHWLHTDPGAGPPPLKRGSSAWLWPLLGGLIAVAGILALVIPQLAKAISPSYPAPVIAPAAAAEPIAEILSTPQLLASPTPTRKPSTPVPTPANARCKVFNGMDFAVIWQDITAGSN